MFLLDEPLSNLDAKLRVQMRADIKKIQANLGVTTIYVTHDQVEAMTMGHRVAVMRKGELQQVADPETLYHRPLNAFVGGFIGSPAMNMVEATGRAPQRRHSTSWSASCASHSVRGGALATHPDLAAYDRRPIVLGIRPESLEDAALAGRRATLDCAGTAELREALGAEMLVHFSIAARPAVTDDVRELAEDVGDDRTLDQIAGGGSATTTDSSDASARAPGSARATRSRSPSSERELHFFDPDSGLAIHGDAGAPW